MRRALPLLLLLPAACATPQRVTWGDAAPVEARAAEPPPVRSPAPVRAVRANQVSPGFAVDRALQMFSSRRALARDLPRTSMEHANTWIDVLDEIDDACAEKPKATDLGAFVRARVTLEVELDHDVHKQRLLPEDIGKRLTRTLRAVDEEVAELRLIAAVGSSRVDLQACKLEYSIVSPK